MISRGTRTLVDHFDRAQAFTTTPGQNGWTIVDVTTGGTPTHLCASEDGGSCALTIVAGAGGAESTALYHNDVLSYDVRQLQRVWWIAKVSGVDAVTTIVIGLASATNATEDSIATNAWFRIEGSVSTSNLLAESDDGSAATDFDDKATGTTLAAVYKKLEIDFSKGISDVRFFCDGARVATGTTFSMANLAAGLNVQPYAKVNRASGSGTPAITVAQFGVVFNYAYGA